MRLHSVLARMVWVGLGLLIVASGASAQTIPSDASVDEILASLEARGAALTTLGATVSLEESDMALGGTKTRRGAFWLQKRDAGQTRLRVQFDTFETETTRSDERIDYVLAGDWLIERNHKMQQEVRRQVRKPGDTTDPLKLGEGPFPLPIGQPVDAVKREFEVTRLPDDPEFKGLIGLELRPKPSSPIARRTESIILWIDPASAFPSAIQTIDVNLVTLRTTRFQDVKLNPDLGDADFTLPEVKDWRLVEEPLE